MRIKTFALIVTMLLLMGAGCNNSPLPQPTATKPVNTATLFSATAISQPEQTRLQRTNAIVLDDLLSTDKPATATRTPTYTSSPTPVITSTPTPTSVPPLLAHEWVPEEIVAFIENKGGDGCHQYPRPPDLVLYSDGQLFINTYTGEGHQLLTKNLSRQEICAFLNTIDQTGFFDYDQATYQLDQYSRPIEYFSIQGSSTQYILVNAWQSNSVSLYGLWSYLQSDQTQSGLPIDSPFQAPTILPAIKNTYSFLSSYMPNGMTVYQPEAIEVWVMDIQQPSARAAVWEVEVPSLEAIILAAEADEHYRNCTHPFENSRKVVFTGADARRIYDVFSQSLHSQAFTDGKIPFCYTHCHCCLI